MNFTLSISKELQLHWSNDINDYNSRNNKGFRIQIFMLILIYLKKELTFFKKKLRKPSQYLHFSTDGK